MSTVLRIGCQRGPCGYCRREGESSVVEGAITYQLTVYDYQRLLDCRWRRCGKYLTRPILEATCCRLQSIRTDVHRFVLSRHQRKGLKTLLKYVGMAVPCAPRDRYLQLLPRDPQLLTGHSFLDAALGVLMASERFAIEHGPAEVDEEAFRLYRRYQMTVHGDSPEEATLSGYRRFLCDTPLLPVDMADGGDLPGFGTLHLRYILDKRLVGVSVLDILPSCYSSVYFFHDPDYRFLSLGTLSALLEIATVRQLSLRVPALHYYYLGYYLGDCQKLAYKARFKPAELLDPTSLGWNAMDGDGGGEDENPHDIAT